MAVVASASITQRSNDKKVIAAQKACDEYKSRGHGGKKAHKPTGIAKARRAARKERNRG